MGDVALHQRSSPIARNHPAPESFWSGKCFVYQGMKAVFKADANRGGFISSTVVPSSRSLEPQFGLVDGAMLIALVLGVVMIVRLVLAN